MTNNLISTKEAAAILDVSPRTVVRWIHDGRLPGVKVNPRAFAIPKEAAIKLAGEIGEIKSKDELSS